MKLLRCRVFLVLITVHRGLEWEGGEGSSPCSPRAWLFPASGLQSPRPWIPLSSVCLSRVPREVSVSQVGKQKLGLLLQVHEPAFRCTVRPHHRGSHTDTLTACPGGRRNGSWWLWQTLDHFRQDHLEFPEPRVGTGARILTHSTLKMTRIRSFSELWP